MEAFVKFVEKESIKILKTEIHSALLESGFVPHDPVEGKRIDDNSSPDSVRFSIYYTLASPPADEVPRPRPPPVIEVTVWDKGRSGRSMVVRGQLTGKKARGTHSLDVDYSEELASAIESGDARALRRKVKNGLCRELLMDISHAIKLPLFTDYDSYLSSIAKKMAKEAFTEDDFQQAADLYSEAILLTPKSAELFSERALANIKLAKFTEAIDDADKAIEFDNSMAKAYLYQGMSYMGLEQYQVATTVLKAGAALPSGENFKSLFTTLIKDCDVKLDGKH